MSNENATIAYFCPECGSPAVDLPVLTGGAATCRACSWSGASNKLAAAPIQHALGSDTELLVRLVGDLRVRMAQDLGTSMLKYLISWGFIQPGDKAFVARQLGRYLAASARAIVVSIIEEREKIEKEKKDGS